MKLERIDVKPDEALFTNKKASGEPILRISLLQAYRKLNNHLGWTNSEKGRFRAATSHMMRKFFNTQLVYAGMPEEIREHFMGHVLENKVRDAYFLQNEEELQKVYLENMDKITIRPLKPPITVSEYKEMKNDQEYLQKENEILKTELKDVKDLISNYDLTTEDPNEELLNDNKQMSEALSGVMFDNQRQQSEINELNELVQNMGQKLKELKKASS